MESLLYCVCQCVSHQESFTLEKYVEKLAQLDQRTGLGPMSKSKVKPFDAQVRLIFDLGRDGFCGHDKTLDALMSRHLNFSSPGVAGVI